MPDLDLPRLRRLAVRAALEGGRVIRQAERPTDIDEKGAGDYVTAVDRVAEEAITELLRSDGGDIPVVGEELGGEGGERHWLVDPLDGTTNYLRRFPAVGVSVALIADGRPVVGAVHAPFLGRTWSAARGRGADRDGRPLRVTDAPPEDAIVGTGFPFRAKRRIERYLGVFVPALERCQDLRRPGAVALDLAWVAEGVFDGFFELGLAPWDVAAGALLIEEAGGRITDWSGGDRYLEGDILAGGPKLHAALLEMARTSEP